MYPRLTNKEIIEQLPKLNELKAEHDECANEIAKLIKRQKELSDRREDLRSRIDVLKTVTEVVDGVAINVCNHKTIYGNDYEVTTVDYLQVRSAEVYTNAHTSVDGKAKDWCVRLISRGAGFGRDKENWLGDSFYFADGVKIARRWVIRAEVPNEAAIRVLRLRHRFDPERKASKKRILAFEAAFLAGNNDLAISILTGKQSL